VAPSSSSAEYTTFITIVVKFSGDPDIRGRKIESRIENFLKKAFDYFLSKISQGLGEMNRKLFLFSIALHFALGTPEKYSEMMSFFLQEPEGPKDEAQKPTLQ